MFYTQIMRKRDDSKERKIQNAVAEIILTEGAAAVSTTRVAKKVGIAQSNVYLYFKNKEALIDSVFEREMSKVRKAQGMDQLQDQSLSLEERINSYLNSLLRFAVENPESLMLIGDIKFLKKVETGTALAETPANNAVIKLLTEGKAAGILKELPISLMMAFIFTTVQAYGLGVKKGEYVESDSRELVLQTLRDAIKK
ncbi:MULTISPECIES: TetR/AcrR family transcriptional regulator [unclassified Enterococcus]|uniref:TetR/AcrR family transcriptional regulator n=1 Tax=unclassified Enterococcus TaxID=2608891 RepID=UPI003D269D34